MRIKRGGQITGSSYVKDYPGVKEKHSGMELMTNWQEQCLKLGLKHEMAKVERLTESDQILYSI